MNNLIRECSADAAKGERTFVLMTYGGHGIQDNFTYAMCSGVDRTNVAFNLEAKARLLSQVDGVYVVALFDCCREKMRVEEVRNGKKSKVEGRGGDVIEEIEEDQD